jgi:Fe2+ or Zn2+ uptake regulation protein
VTHRRSQDELLTEFKNIIRADGLKFTAQREAILQTLDKLALWRVGVEIRHLHILHHLD